MYRTKNLEHYLSRNPDAESKAQRKKEKKKISA